MRKGLLLDLNQFIAISFFSAAVSCNEKQSKSEVRYTISKINDEYTIYDNEKEKKEITTTKGRVERGNLVFDTERLLRSLTNLEIENLQSFTPSSLEVPKEFIDKEPGNKLTYQFPSICMKNCKSLELYPKLKGELNERHRKSLVAFGIDLDKPETESSILFTSNNKDHDIVGVELTIYTISKPKLQQISGSGKIGYGDYVKSCHDLLPALNNCIDINNINLTDRCSYTKIKVINSDFTSQHLNTLIQDDSANGMVIKGERTRKHKLSSLKLNLSDLYNSTIEIMKKTMLDLSEEHKLCLFQISHCEIFTMDTLNKSIIKLAYDARTLSGYKIYHNEFESKKKNGTNRKEYGISMESIMQQIIVLSNQNKVNSNVDEKSRPSDRFDSDSDVDNEQFGKKEKSKKEQQKSEQSNLEKDTIFELTKKRLGSDVNELEDSCLIQGRKRFNHSNDERKGEELHLEKPEKVDLLNNRNNYYLENNSNAKRKNENIFLSGLSYVYSDENRKKFEQSKAYSNINSNSKTAIVNGYIKFNYIDVINSRSNKEFTTFISNLRDKVKEVNKQDRDMILNMIFHELNKPKELKDMLANTNNKNYIPIVPRNCAVLTCLWNFDTVKKVLFSLSSTSTIKEVIQYYLFVLFFKEFIKENPKNNNNKGLWCQVFDYLYGLEITSNSSVLILNRLLNIIEQFPIEAGDNKI